MKSGLLLDPIYKKHDTGPGHPERAARIEAVARALDAQGLTGRCARIVPRPATDDEITTCHTDAYLGLVRKEIADGTHLLSTGDTMVCGESLDVALEAAGGVIEAVDAVFEGRIANAFCAVRPPGHHASAARGMGFCVFNNVAVAARSAQKKHGAERVAIIDWDVHHGNGTQDIFYADASVFYFSSHQSPWYPGTGHPHETGEGKGEGTTLNTPFPAGTGMDDIGRVFRERLVPALDAFRPDLVLLSAGFDSRLGDPLGGFRLTDPDFVELSKRMIEVADKHAGGRLVSVLEGGYNVRGLAAAVCAHLGALMGLDEGGG